MDIYSLEDRTVDHILDVVDAEMAPPPKQPKVLLFDIGGVCVLSPLQAILDYELSLGIPPGWVNFSISRAAPNGWWHRLESGSIPMDAVFFRGFNADLHDAGRWREFYAREQAKDPQKLPAQVPPMPTVDGEWLFHEMMSQSASPDPWMLPALNKLKASGKYIIAALSNTVIFPKGHRMHEENFFSGPVRGVFDVFISSAHVGLRKPDPRVYQLALQEVDRFARENGRPAEGVAPGDVVFLDDIGENLKEARNQGFRTIKVNLGRAYEAVEELEALTGLKLEGSHPKIPIKPKYTKDKARM